MGASSVLRSVGAVIAGALTGIVLSVGTDAVLSVAGVLPPLGQAVDDRLLLLAMAYRTAYGVLGAYLTAWLAPSRPMAHALWLGFLGLIATTAGAVATWGRPPALGHEWYALALVVLAMPPAWAGGRLREMQLRAHSQG
jgi:hypothetical protein